MRKLKITELNRISAEEFKQVEKLPLVVVLDDIRSLHNIGSVFRTSDAFRIECIYLCGITATPPHPEIHKTALGAEFTVDWKYVNNAVDAVDNLKNEGYIVYSVEDVYKRQGEPFPVYYKDGMPYMIDEASLPLELPEVAKFLPTETGEPPLGHATKWAWDTVCLLYTSRCV